ncbi:helix-turn-helix domain-containing protein [Pedobacter endophyticus]|uniref:Helix-turn-helix domain-containing protein n=1 Tax=Pedobacter endophyticus TaxID=2789740 RepID=A0A7S9L3C9_9SPHI|nr:helix-turn-helix domain-containing protein [Pedobacter endophyticus]QPH41713.1 helix-turn-helix domain-containing protein [Pedobacter endophyticus]
MQQLEETSIPAEIAARFVNYTSKHVFLTGKAGTGKTTFLRKLIQLTHKRALICAPTGIAAINAAGTTIHSLFQLPFGAFFPDAGAALMGETIAFNFNTPRTIVKHLNMQANKRRMIQELELLVIDEVSMLRADMLDAIDFSLRYIRRNRGVPFGGVQLLFIGDLHQLPPVVKTNEWQVMAKFYKSIYFFDALALQNNPPVYIELDKIYRQDDQVFIDLLNNLRNNQITAEDTALLKQHYKQDFKPKPDENYITLTTHNNKADTINRERLAQLTTKSYFFDAKVTGEFNEYAYPNDKRLELKVGAQIMFIKNDMSAEKRYYNGKIGVVHHIEKELIEIELPDDRVTIQISPYTWENVKYKLNEVTNEIDENVAGSFVQYPIKLAWAITVHKSQGLTFDKAIIDIGDAFAPGQAYVALSRLRSLNGLVLTSHLRESGLQQDQNIHYFAQSKQPAEILNEQISAESFDFARTYLTSAFDLNIVRYYLKEHLETFDKSEAKSTKQRYDGWTMELYKEFQQLTATADTFVNQLKNLFAQQTEHTLFNVSKRVEAAVKYFNPLIKGVSDKFLAQIEAIKEEKGIKTYLTELLELELLVFEQLKKMHKSKALLLAMINGREFSKADTDALLNTAERNEQLKKANQLKGATLKPRSAADKKKKEPKVDTKLVSFELYEQGKTIDEIAAERGFSVGTIEGHLAYYVSTQQLDVAKLVKPNKIKNIADAAESQKTKSMATIREFLGKDYSFGEIKLVLASLFPSEE